MTYYSPYNQPGAKSNLSVSEFVHQHIKMVGMDKYQDAEAIVKFSDVFGSILISDEIFPVFKDWSSLFEDKMKFEDYVSQLNVITGESVYLDERSDISWCFKDYLIATVHFSADISPEYQMIRAIRFSEFVTTSINIQGGKQDDKFRPSATMQTAM